MENQNQSRQQARRINSILAIIIILIIIFLFFKIGYQKIFSGEKAPPPEYTPPVNYQLSPGEKYTPPFP